MNKIIPSVRLKVVTVHKLWSLSCWRQYFWTRVLNLEPKKMNFNFWYGGVLHAGFETLLLKGLKAAKNVMKNESRKRCSRYSLSADDQEEMGIQMRLLLGIIEQAAKQPFIKKMKLSWAERQFKMKLKQSGLTFCTRIDGFGRYNGDKSLFEIKTASRVDNNYFTALAFDKQIHGYAHILKAKKEPCPSQCCYCVFRKPQKRIKKGQTVDGFVKEIKQDLIDRPDWYYILYKHRLGKLTIEQTMKDIETTSELLLNWYKNLGEKRLLNPDSWPRNEKQCLSYGVCPYLILCKYPKKWQLYTRLFQQRELMYEEEKNELQY